MILFATGHRPNKTGGYTKEALAILIQIAMNSLKELKPKTVIVGGALGWDTAVALACIALNIPFILAIPFEGQELFWPKESQDTYNYIRSKASKVVVISTGGYSAKKMQIRNIWMVDNADEGLSLFDGTYGGTFNCVKYAESKGKFITNVWEKFKP